MHNNILQQYGYSQLAPSNYKSSYSYHHTPVDVQSQGKTAETPEKPNVTSYQSLNISPVLPGSGNNYVSSRLSHVNQDGAVLGTTYDRSDEHSTAYKYVDNTQKMVSNKDAFNKSTNYADDSAIDIENDSNERLQSSDTSSFTDSSPGSISPKSTSSLLYPSGSENSPPLTSGEPVSTPDSESKQTKKNSRTNYTNEQIQKLLRIFHENPYPDSEMMETIGHDLGVPESRIKIWFQNKRARWRRRVNNANNAASFPQPFMPMSPMFSPMSPYGFMPSGHMMTSSPTPMMYPGYYNYPAMQTQTNSLSPNSAGSRVPMGYPVTSSVTQQFPFGSTHQTMPSTSSPQSYRITPPLSSMALGTLPYMSRNTTPLSSPSSLPSATLPYTARNTSPVSVMTSPNVPFSSGNALTTAPQNNRYSLYEPSYSS